MGRSTQPVPPPTTSSYGAVLPHGTIFASASRAAATYNGDPSFNAGWAGVKIIVDISVHNGGTLNVKVQSKDPVSGNWVDIPGAATAALSGSNQTKTLTLLPGVTETANEDVATTLPGLWRVVATTSVAAVTFSISGEYLAS